jgi:hypothetical protein
MRDRVFAWLGRIKNVEREHTATRLATDHLQDSIQAGSKVLGRGLKRMDVSRASDNLEVTYVIRLFVEFEVALKHFLRSKKLKIPRRAEHLINRVAARAAIAGLGLTNAHRVRIYRNHLVHRLEDEGEALSIRTATSFLCTFLDRLQTVR